MSRRGPRRPTPPSMRRAETRGPQRRSGACRYDAEEHEKKKSALEVVTVHEQQRQPQKAGFCGRSRDDQHARRERDESREDCSRGTSGGQVEDQQPDAHVRQEAGHRRTTDPQARQGGTEGLQTKERKLEQKPGMQVHGLQRRIGEPSPHDQIHGNHGGRGDHRGDVPTSPRVSRHPKFEGQKEERGQDPLFIEPERARCREHHREIPPRCAGHSMPQVRVKRDE